jgi:hypothetical protein
MTNPNIEKLLKVIEERRSTLRDYGELFGGNDKLTLSVFNELIGLEEAFQIVVGMPDREYILSRD